MANKPKPKQDRRAKVEELRRQQQARERRKTLLTVGIGAFIGLALIAAVVVPQVIDSADSPGGRAVSAFGVAPAAADCDEPTDDPVSGSGDHVEGTVDYDTVPPTSGPHHLLASEFPRRFYAADDRPAMEELVHRLEHGYTIVWYDDTVEGQQLEDLRGLSERTPAEAGKGKFIVSGWDDAYGEFPEGKHIALSHWGKDMGHRQLCGQLSGQVVLDFMNDYPATDSPEPAGV